jgi:hypothetical protein
MFVLFKPRFNQKFVVINEEEILYYIDGRLAEKN